MAGHWLEDSTSLSSAAFETKARRDRLTLKKKTTTTNDGENKGNSNSNVVKNRPNLLDKSRTSSSVSVPNKGEKTSEEVVDNKENVKPKHEKEPGPSVSVSNEEDEGDDGSYKSESESAYTVESSGSDCSDEEGGDLGLSSRRQLMKQRTKSLSHSQGSEKSGEEQPDTSSEKKKRDSINGRKKKGEMEEKGKPGEPSKADAPAKKAPSKQKQKQEVPPKKDGQKMKQVSELIHIKKEKKNEKEEEVEVVEVEKDKKEDEKEEKEEVPLTQEQLESQRAANVSALTGNLPMVVQRRPMLPSILTVKGAEAILRRPFKSPCLSPTNNNNLLELKRRLAMRKRFVPWGSKGVPSLPSSSSQGSESVPEEEEGGEPLVLWQSKEDPEQSFVDVDKKLTKFLRPHQREGVQFMFECVTGLKEFDGNGCILADDMGLGKTLQGITLLWTLLKQGAEELGGKPVVKRAVIVCPTSLVGNWDDELDKWLDGRVKSLALAESSRDDAIMGIDQFLSPRKPYDVLIVSYETFRIHTKKFKREGSLDLLICDEAHRLKNAETQTNQALNDLPCKRRVLLSGTPMQNHLDEFYAMVNFTNPGVLGTPAHFRRHFEGPVLAGREPDATEKQIEKSNERSLELSTIVNEFILRRTNSLLSKHLPPKTIEIVCCKMTKLQEDLYKHFLHSKVAKQLLNAGKSSTRVLSAITALKKLCNHPKLIYDVVNSMQKDTVPDGFEDCGKFFPPGVFDNGRVGRGGMALGWENFSGKMAVLSRLLSNLRPTGDRIVLVSNYTQTLDLFVQLCREKRFPYVRLDGSISIKKRMKLVKEFNDPAQDQFVFLLSSKAGGCGLNLIGANRLILFDPDWNPATDKQAAARVWRDGQKKYVFTYRFFATGTIEEKVFQRQLSKEGLQGLVSKDGKAKSNSTSSEVLRDLFRYRGEDTFSDTYDNCDAGNRESLEEKDKEVWNQVGEPAEEDLKHWAHHFNLENLPDPIMQKSAGNDISFVFSCDVKGQDLSKMNGNKENEKEEEEEEEEKPQLNTLQQRRGVLNILNTNAGGVARQPGLLRSRLPANNLKRKILQSRAAAALSTKKRQIEDSGDEESVTEESMEESDLDLESDEDDGGGESSEDFSE